MTKIVPLIKDLFGLLLLENKNKKNNRVIALVTSCKILNRQQTWIWVKSMIIMPKKCMFDYKIKNWYYVYIHNITNKHYCTYHISVIDSSIWRSLKLSAFLKKKILLRKKFFRKRQPSIINGIAKTCLRLESLYK